MRIRSAIGGFFEARFDRVRLRGAIDEALREPVPAHAGWGHAFASLALMGFALQFFTGVLLLVYYRPTADEAYASVEFITYEVQFGWLVRQCHAWGATLMVIALLCHMGHTFLRAAYKRPRELTWITGVILLVLVMGFGFTGYLLPWNQRAYWGTIVGTDAGRSIPIIGDWMLTMLRGDQQVGSETLSRFFTLHVIVFPWLLAGMIGVHLALMRMQGLTTRDRVGEERALPPAQTVPFFPVHVLREATLATIAFGVLTTLAVVWPMELGEPADPLETPPDVKPEWYFLPIYQTLKYFEGSTGKLVGLLVANAPLALLVLLPFLDRGRERLARKRPVMMTLACIGVAAGLLLGVLGYVSGRRVSVFGMSYDVDHKGVPTLVTNVDAEEHDASDNIKP